MPTTLSSGVVMTGSAGGNMAHALLVTILSNGLAVFTVPVSLDLLLSLAGNGRTVTIDPIPTMLKIGTLVLLPLALGMAARALAGKRLLPLLPAASAGSQLGILAVVWAGACLGREAIVGNLDQVAPILVLSMAFHGLLLAVAFALARLAGRGKGRRESVILMGCQKTLPLSIILQVAFFPDYGLVLVVCVLHHVIHLVMDAALIRRLSAPN
jgi:sodium/bile acid cotransporter 7